MSISTTAVIDRVAEVIDDAVLVAWDGCHKIYLAMDETEAAFFRSDYPHVVEAGPETMTAAAADWWDESCSLRFISAVHHDAEDPNRGFTDVVAQFESEDDE